MTGGLGRDGSGSIQDGISGARAGIRQGWLGGDSSAYHEPKAVSQPRVNMEGGFPFLSGKTARLHSPASLAGKIRSCDSVPANRMWVG